MSRPRESVQRLSFRIKAIWLSVLSWMHWSRRRAAREETLRLRQLQEIEVLLLQERVRADLEWKLQLQEAKFREALLEALRPVAAAMQRQDSLAERRQDNLQELLMEVLTSLQPSAEEQIFPRIGQPPPRRSSPSLVS